ncbi:MAG: hypothetical protein OXC29_25250 [Rhodococcus sp.]|nr:hypothetical protein [Rhodococcus sp. (in: high G+C Gram-positive bacteria)]
MTNVNRAHLISHLSRNGIAIEQSVQQVVSLSGMVARIGLRAEEAEKMDLHAAVSVVVDELDRAERAIRDGAQGHAAQHLAQVLTGIGVIAYVSDLAIGKEFLDTLFRGVIGEQAANDDDDDNDG